MHAGHGLDYASAETIAALPEIVELNIGHFLIGEAVFTGLAAAIKTMRAAMDRGRAKAAAELPHERFMILGLGSDITDARRIAKVIERHGDRFLTRVFTDIERAKAERRKNRAETYAKRFAAKEACAKALGTGIRHGVWWRDMGVVNLPSRPADHGADRRRAKAPRRAHAQGPPGADRPHHHRRGADGGGVRRHLGGAGRKDAAAKSRREQTVARRR